MMKIYKKIAEMTPSFRIKNKRKLSFWLYPKSSSSFKYVVICNSSDEVEQFQMIKKRVFLKN